MRSSWNALFYPLLFNNRALYNAYLSHQSIQGFLYG